LHRARERDTATVAKQPKTVYDNPPKKRSLKLHDLTPRKTPKGGSSKKQSTAKKPSSTVPRSLEDFLKSDSLRIEP
jgi:hypothetical protein